ncbi:hypothetical protein Tco_1402007 [Tanacetum coccineum]
MQVWKPTGKVLTSVGHQWRPTGRIFTLGEQCPLTRLTKPKVAPAKQKENQAITCRTDRPLLDFRNDHFGAIMGYGDYVIGDSVISRVYYVEGLGHNMFSVLQFYDSDMEVAFKKHSCYVRDTDGVELIKGSRGSNLYTISIEDMMKSSPICLLSKASKNKSFGCSNNADLLQGPDVSMGRSYCYCLLHLKSIPYSYSSYKTPYELVHDKKPDLTFFRVFGALCYPTNDNEDLGKLQSTTDIGISVGYAPSRKVPVPVNSDSNPSIYPIESDCTSSKCIHRLPGTTFSSLHQGVAAECSLIEENLFAPVDNDPLINIFAPEPTSEASLSRDVSSENQPTSLKHFIISENRARITRSIMSLATHLDRYPPENNLQPMPCGACITM